MIYGNLVAVAPPLHGGVILMAERQRELAHPEPFDDLGMGFHSPFVRPSRTYVNVESVPASGDDADMGSKSIGERLLALKTRTGWSLDEIAERAGYKGRSSVQALFRVDYDPSNLDAKVARKLADAFVGQGDPPIQADEIWSLVGHAIPPTVPSEEDLRSILESVHAGLPPGLPLAEWFPSVAAGLRTRLALIANERASSEDEGPPREGDGPRAHAPRRPNAAGHRGSRRTR